MRLKVLLFLMIIAVSAIVANGGFFRSRSIEANLAVVTTGDSAQVVAVTPGAAVYDSFNYIDSFSYQYDTSVYKTVTWTSPLQVARLRVGVADPATVYSCSVAFAAQTLGFDVDPGAGYTTIASIVDTITYLINNTTNLTDSVVAEDSITYVKIVSLFSTGTFTDKWLFSFGVTGGTGTLDTTTHGNTTTTIAMICDSMSAYINADANVDSFVTAANSGDTIYTVTSDDAGVLFFIAVFGETGGTGVADSLQDTAHVQVNVISYSTSMDTIGLDYLVYPDKRIHSIYGRFILEPSAMTTQGIGLVDTATLILYSGIGGRLLYIDSAKSTGLPCTLDVALKDATDTLLREDLQLTYRITDTASDTTATIPYKIKASYIISE